MASKCALTHHRSRRNNIVSRLRANRVSRRTNSVASINLQRRNFITPLGKLSLKISNRTNRTIEKFGGVENFLLTYRKSKLSDLALKLRNKFSKHNSKHSTIKQ